MSIMQMLLGTSSGQSVNIADVFDVIRFEGNQTARSINTGLDMTDGEGLVWIKNVEENSRPPYIFDTVRGANVPGATDGDGVINATINNLLTSFNNNGFSVGISVLVNQLYDDTIAWSMKEAPGFLDIVEYNGDGVNGRAISHNLGQTPGMIIVKKQGGTTGFDWMVWHSGLSVSNACKLNENVVPSTSPGLLTAAPTSSVFNVKDSDYSNGTGESYMAYVFANNSNGVKCSTYTGNFSTQSVNVGFQVQWVLIKNVSSAGHWMVLDSVRTHTDGTSMVVRVDSSSKETVDTNGVTLTSTGFNLGASVQLNTSGDDYIYMAIAAS